MQSVFDLISTGDRNRLLSARNRKPEDGRSPQRRVDPGASGERERVERREVAVREEVVLRTGGAVAAGSESRPRPSQAAHRPYPDDPSKQERYELYRCGRRSFSGTEYDRLTEWEKQRELKDFHRTCRVYRPLEKSLTDKFTRGRGEEGERQSLKDSEEAAKMEMFGVMTRDASEWHPHRVLCKRFNIPDPYPRWVVHVYSYVGRLRFRLCSSEDVGVVSEESRQQRTVQFHGAEIPDRTQSSLREELVEEKMVEEEKMEEQEVEEKEEVSK